MNGSCRKVEHKKTINAFSQPWGQLEYSESTVRAMYAYLTFSGKVLSSKFLNNQIHHHRPLDFEDLYFIRNRCSTFDWKFRIKSTGYDPLKFTKLVWWSPNRILQVPRYPGIHLSFRTATSSYQPRTNRDHCLSLVRLLQGHRTAHLELRKS